ncbi:MAG: 2-oxo acid dehydrogenase subunit E2 [Clostridia bacterium]|nr:2-oxo acid dehydrogenase subunit E2 [Clostridia bacterium]
MATAVIMPRQGQSVESCIIGEWCKKVGDQVNAGDILFTYETDKAAFEEEAKESGILLAVFCEAGDDVPCLSTVAVIGQAGEDYSSLIPAGSAPAAAPVAVTETAPEREEAAPTAAPAAATAERAAGISPRARAAAERLGTDPTLATPTGPNGRVIERDVIALASSGVRATPAALKVMATGLGGRLTSLDLQSAPAAAAGAASPEAPYVDTKLSNIRRVIARSMHQSLSEMAQLTHNSSFDATALQSIRKQLKQASAKNAAIPNITLNDMIMFATAKVLKNHPDLNAHFLGDTIRRFSGVHLGMAVDTPRGLLVPTIFNADSLTLPQLSNACKELARQAQSGAISPDKLTGASFTVSNLGMFGIESFTPVINPPQTGILGVDCITERVRTVNGAVTTYPAMGLSLTYDHRALDGAPASRFLQELCFTLENFTALLI